VSDRRIPAEPSQNGESEDDTQYLLKSSVMKSRLLAAIERNEGLSVEEAIAQLSAQFGGLPIDWSDSWSEEDLADFTAASISRFEEEFGD
jgi:hypothetical protein